MNILDGIKNFLQLINDNWTTIIVIVALIISIVKKIRDLLVKRDNEKLEIAKKQIKETILKLITEAEFDYDEFKKAGSIKRSQVIGEIFDMYPVLSKITDQEEIIEWLDDVIDESLETLRDIIEKQED